MLGAEHQKRFLTDASGAFTAAAGAWGLQGATVVELKAVDEETLGEVMTLAWQTAVAKGPTKTSTKSAKKPTRVRSRSS